VFVYWLLNYKLHSVCSCLKWIAVAAFISVLFTVVVSLFVIFSFVKLQRLQRLQGVLSSIISSVDLRSIYNSVYCIFMTNVYASL